MAVRTNLYVRRSFAAGLLTKAGANAVRELLKGEGTYYEWNHYPDGNIYDNETHSQYYYYAYRENEHDHFHTFSSPFRYARRDNFCGKYK